MKNIKPEVDKKRRQLMKWLAITGGVSTLGGMIPTSVFAADDDEIRIDSLFLDEGYGTLDVDTLDTALDSLNVSDKTIGAISHVEVMKDRISVQIKVAKVNGFGVNHPSNEFKV
ncbi:hypothetical protein J1789_23995 [Rahnella aceris]|jgi:hypothetical protein|nr:exonuclease SbcC [Rahnella aceris]AFE59635.1 exonuclease SbcC [Rahnella aquatilis HX2]MBU9863095.1 hypothetical protein [Rahnella aceris]